MIKEKLVSIFFCCVSGWFKKNEEEEAASKGEELEEEEEDKKHENEEKGEDDEMVNKGVILEEDEKQNNEEKEEQQTDDDEMVNESEPVEEEEEEKKQNNEEKGGEEQKADEKMVNEGEELEVEEKEEEEEDDDDEKQNNEENGEEQKVADEMVNEGEALEEEDDDDEKQNNEENGEEMVNKTDEKWIKHYSSSQKILLVGEGDFSFSAALGTAFGTSASNIIATSLDSHGFLAENYSNAVSNIAMLRRRGCKVMHGVDATDMANHPSLKGLKFDRIVFNFPYAGFFKTKSRSSQLLIHQALMKPFLENAVRMIGEDGEIHIRHKTNGFHREWDIAGLAYQQGLELVKAEDFVLSDYPGYNTKRGFGGDDNFNCYPSKTYIFRSR